MSTTNSDRSASLLTALDILRTAAENDDDAYAERARVLPSDDALDEALRQAQSQIEILESTQKALTTTLTRKRLFVARVTNRRSRLAALPPELIQLIFIEGFADHIPAFLSFSDRQETIIPYLRTLSHTCSDWREVALSTSYLWSFISLDWHPSVVRVWLQRAGEERDLHIRTVQRGSVPVLERSNSQYSQREPHDVYANFHRWRTLVAPYAAREDLQCISSRIPDLHQARNYGPNRLRTLHLLDEELLILPEEHELEITINQAFLRPSHPNSPASPELFPSLRSLALWSSTISPLGCLTHIRELDLCVVSWDSWDVFNHVLAQAAQLQNLRMTAMPPSTLDNEASCPLELSHLRDLTLGPGSHDSFLRSWFLDVTAPDLRNFTVEFSPRRGEIDHILSWLETFLLKSSHVTSLACRAQGDVIINFLDAASAPSQQSESQSIILPELESLRIDLAFMFRHPFQRERVPAVEAAIRRFASRSRYLEDRHGSTCVALRMLTVPLECDVDDLDATIPTCNKSMPNSFLSTFTVWHDVPAQVLGGFGPDFTEEGGEGEWEDEDGEDGDLGFGSVYMNPGDMDELAQFGLHDGYIVDGDVYGDAPWVGTVHNDESVDEDDVLDAAQW